MLITPITNRSLSDISYIKEIARRIKSVGWDNATETDKLWWLYGSSTVYSLIASTEPLITYDGFELSSRSENQSINGVWNIIDHDRVANNINFLRDLLSTYGYVVTFDDIQTVVMSDLPYYTTLFEEIDTKLHQLLSAFYTFDHEDFVLSQQLDYHDFNVLESLIQTLYDLILLMVESFNYCGTFYTGGTIML